VVEEQKMMIRLKKNVIIVLLWVCSTPFQWKTCLTCFEKKKENLAAIGSYEEGLCCFPVRPPVLQD
jgi:hypothetical protein